MRSFDEQDERAKKIKRKVDEGFLKAASISALVHSTSSASRDKLPHQKGSTATKSTLLEASIVDIPGNEGALAQNHVQLSFLSQAQQITQSTTEDMEKRLQKALCKQLSLPQGSDEDTLLEAVEQMLKKQKELASTLQAERSAAAQQQIRAAVSAGALAEEDTARYLRLFAADRALGNEMLEASLAQHAQAQQQAAAQQSTLRAVVAGAPASSPAPADKPLDEAGIKQLAQALKHDPEAFTKQYQTNLRKHEVVRRHQNSESTCR